MQVTKKRIMSSSNFIATTSMQNLIELGWDFTGDYDHETSPHKEFHHWVENCDVEILFRDGHSQYVIEEYKGPEKGWVDWAGGDTGDDDKTADDIIALHHEKVIHVEDDDQ